MQLLISQTLLPIALALVMFSMGLGLSKQDFKSVFSQPKLALTGLSLQLLALPLLALSILWLLQLSPVASAGLLLVALSPGGATSNLFSYLAKGNLALSISLTAISSLIVPFSLPLIFAIYMQYSGETIAFNLPLALMIKQLVAVTLVPVVLGMICRAYLFNLTQKLEGKIKTLATCCMLAVIAGLILTNLPLLKNGWSASGMAVLSLSCLSLLMAYTLSRKLSFDIQITRTLAIEAGVQNAGTAMLVALSLLKQPELAQVPLLYGLLMNLPVFLFIAYCRYQHKKELC